MPNLMLKHINWYFKWSMKNKNKIKDADKISLQVTFRAQENKQAEVENKL